MEIYSYIMTVATSQNSIEVFLAIKNIVGTGHAEYGTSGEYGAEELWIVPKSKKSPEELVSLLNTLPFIRKVSVVRLSKPITGTELSEVRELFNGLGFDTSALNEERLSLFLDARMQGKFTYLLDIIQDKAGKPGKIRIIKAEEHPRFSPEWLTYEPVQEEILERELTIDDLDIKSVVVELVVEDLPPPPPPPPPPASPTGDEEF